MADTTVADHIMLKQRHWLLYYMRFIEHEVPKLTSESTERMPLNTVSQFG